MTDRDHQWLDKAIELSKQCPPATEAFSVGAILVTDDDHELARGYSRETEPKNHAEEAALAKLDHSLDLAGSTLYSSLEPCSERATVGRPPCADLIIERGIGRVVIAWREPGLFVADCVGVERLRQASIEVIELPEFAAAAKAVNNLD